MLLVNDNWYLMAYSMYYYIIYIIHKIQLYNISIITINKLLKYTEASEKNAVSVNTSRIRL